MEIECTCNFVIKTGDKHYNTCAINLAKRVSDGEFPNGLPRDENARMNLINPYLSPDGKDNLYHIALDTESHNLGKIFGDVKFVCMGGTAQRMEEFANIAIKELGIEMPAGCGLVDMAAASQRYALYKVGPIISINHGVGMSTMSVVLQEIIKVLQYAKAKDPIIFRIGTSGGIDVEPGTVVISDKAYNGMLNQTYELEVLGKLMKWPAIFDECLAEELKIIAVNNFKFPAVAGGTMGANDFYNGQGRLDGAFCDHTKDDKMNFLIQLKKLGIKNIEMEAPCFAAVTHKVAIKAADVCVTLVNRLEGDQVTMPKDTILEIQKRPMYVVLEYMKAYLKKMGTFPYGMSCKH